MTVLNDCSSTKGGNDYYRLCGDIVLVDSSFLRSKSQCIVWDHSISNMSISNALLHDEQHEVEESILILRLEVLRCQITKRETRRLST